MYRPEKWVPRPKTRDVFLIALDNLDDIKLLLSATSVRTAYNRYGTILVEWTLMHRESFVGLVGQYIIRNERGEYEVLDREELLNDYEPYSPPGEIEAQEVTHPQLGKILAVETRDGEFTEVLFELPDGTPQSFVTQQYKKETAKESPKPKAPNKENN